MPLAPTVKLADGNSIPIIGLGTWKSPPGKVYQAVKAALEIGYRHLDCAFAYQNETEVGQALKDSIEAGIVRREDVFITSKCWNTFHKEDRVEECCRKTLEALGTDYVDLYLVHWPFGYKEGDEVFPRDENGTVITSDVDFLETWRGMEKVHKAGLARSLGLSNFNSEQIQRVLDTATVKPVMLQVECHPYLNQQPLINWCREHDIAVTAYSPLGSPDRPWAKPDDPQLLDDPKIKAMAEKYGKTAAQIIIKYQVQRGVIVIPKSVTPERIAENFNIFDFELIPEDVSIIDSFNRNHRFLHLDWNRKHPYYPFNIPF